MRTFTLFSRTRLSRTTKALTASVATLALAGGLLVAHGAPRTDDTSTTASTADTDAIALVAKTNTNPVTPGNFTGYGFDQCVAPTQKSMDKWLNHSPYLAVGIYISGDSRACRVQPNLNPTWISTQLRKGWRLLPIALGPQASCLGRFPRYADDFKINPKPGAAGKWNAARKQGIAEARKNAADADALGIAKKSTIWYDLEGFTYTNKNCRESALSFISGWVGEIEKLGFTSGMYSGASSGILMVDEARRNRAGQYNLPKQIWIARWDGKANTSTTYISDAGWNPGNRMKQYLGGHNEKHGGVTINIDSNWLDLGTTRTTGSARCGTRIGFASYPNLRSGSKQRGRVKALKCLLREQGHWNGNGNGTFGTGALRAVRRWQTANGIRPTGVVGAKQWVRLLSHGPRTPLKRGSSGADVHRLQQALTAAGVRKNAVSTGVFDAATDAQLRTYMRKVKMTRAHGVANSSVWKRLNAGER